MRPDKRANRESDADIFGEKRVQMDLLIFALSLAHKCIWDQNGNNSQRKRCKISAMETSSAVYLKLTKLNCSLFVKTLYNAFHVIPFLLVISIIM